MKPLMNSETAGSRVLLFAVEELAHEWLQPGMNQLVCLKMPLRNELHVALLTLKGPFTSVRPHMGLKVSSLPELL